MGKGSGGGGGSTTSTSSVPGYMQPGMQYAYNQAVQLYKDPKYYQDSTVAGFGNQTEAGLTGMESLAAGGAPIIDAAQAQTLKNINGDYLSPQSNPYLQQLIDQTSRDTTRNYKTAVMPEIDSAFAQAGRFGSGAQANASDSAKYNLAQALGDISTNINYQNYAAERGYQNNSINNAGAMDDLKYNPSRILSQVGAARDTMAQAKLDDEVARYEYNRDAPTQRLNDFIAQLNGLSGNQGTQITTQNGGGGGSKAGGALSGAASGAAMGSTFGPWGAVAGGAIGGISGLMG